MPGIFNTFASSRIRHLVGVVSLSGGLAVLGIASLAAAQTAAPTVPAPASTGSAAVTPARPVIRASVNGQPLAGTLASYCWPQGDQPPCVLVDNPQPSGFAAVKAADTITFSVDSVAGAPASLTATLPNDLNSTGQPTVSDLLASQNVYSVPAALPNGDHVIIVQAVYPPDANGNQGYVDYAFDLRVSGSLSTKAVTVSPAARVTPIGTGTAAPLTTPAGGGMVSTVQPIGTLAMSATPANPGTPIETNPTTLPTQGSTLIQPTLPPLATIAQLPTATAIVIDGVPALTVNVNSVSYQPIAITLSQVDQNGQLQTITRPVDTKAPLIKVPTGTLVQVSFTGPGPVTELFTLGNADGTQMISQVPVAAASTVSYTMPTTPGLYTLYVALHWTGDNPLTSQATYVFRLEITR